MLKNYQRAPGHSRPPPNLEGSFEYHQSTHDFKTFFPKRTKELLTFKTNSPVNNLTIVIAIAKNPDTITV